MKSFEYFAPRTIQETIAVLHDQGPEGKVLAGGTDLMVAMKERGVRPRYVVGLSQVRELRGIDDLGEGGLSIRAATTAYDIEFNPVVRQRYPVLVQGVELIGSRQVQALGTLGGNLCNAAPSADGAQHDADALRRTALVIEGEEDANADDGDVHLGARRVALIRAGRARRRRRDAYLDQQLVGL